MHKETFSSWPVSQFYQDSTYVRWRIYFGYHMDENKNHSQCFKLDLSIMNIDINDKH